MDQNGGVDGGDLVLFLQWHEAGFAGDHTLDAQRFLYRGYHWDDILKMCHVRHRVYDPARMLWIQRDPLGRIPGVNEYAYCLGEPVDSYDPYGLWDWDNDWVETAVSLFLPTKQGDAAREGFVQGAKDGATMAADNLTFQQIAPLNREAKRIRSENAGDWTYEIGDSASVVGRNALLAAGGIAAGSMFMATPWGMAVGQAIIQSPTAVLALQGMAALGAAGGRYSVGTGIYNISTGNYKEGIVQIGNGVIALVTTFSGAMTLGKAGNAPANGNGCQNSPAGMTPTSTSPAPSTSPSTKPHFSGPSKPWTKNATPESIYTHVDPKTGRAVQNAIYDSNGNVIGHVDFSNHGAPDGPSGRGHFFPVPGNPASGHGPGLPHIPNGQLPPGWDRLPPGISPRTPIGQ